MTPLQAAETALSTPSNSLNTFWPTVAASSFVAKARSTAVHASCSALLRTSSPLRGMSSFGERGGEEGGTNSKLYMKHRVDLAATACVVVLGEAPFRRFGGRWVKLREEYYLSLSSMPPHSSVNSRFPRISRRQALFSSIRRHCRRIPSFAVVPEPTPVETRPPPPVRLSLQEARTQSGID